MVESLPVDCHLLAAIELIRVKKLAVRDPKFVHHLGDLYIEATVFRDIEHPFFAPPFYRVHAASSFSDSESRHREVVEVGLATDPFFDLKQDIQGS
jgi:hypothetical protein